ncbi:hypothetical protein LCGC14_1446360 [marine sediment metagenome]|uniref:Uncharacterized protein n=1 Tax=marine sediment metagenome TaxID=412755 RepID=A0A0F9JJU7_9ZZZZ
MRKKDIFKLFIYLFCFGNLIGGVILMFVAFYNMILFGGIILYDYNRTLLLFEFISVIISLIILPFLLYDIFLKKERFYYGI